MCSEVMGLEDEEHCKRIFALCVFAVLVSVPYSRRRVSSGHSANLAVLACRKTEA